MWPFILPAVYCFVFLMQSHIPFSSTRWAYEMLLDITHHFEAEELYPQRTWRALGSQLPLYIKLNKYISGNILLCIYPTKSSINVKDQCIWNLIKYNGRCCYLDVRLHLLSPGSYKRCGKTVYMYSGNFSFQITNWGNFISVYFFGYQKWTGNFFSWIVIEVKKPYSANNS